MIRPVPNTKPTRPSATTLTSLLRGPILGCHGGFSSDCTPLTSPPESSSVAYAAPPAVLPEVASAPRPMNAPTEAAANAAHTDRVANDGMVVALMADADAMLSAPAVSKTVAAMKPTSMKTPVYAMDRGDRRALPQMPWPDVHPLPMAEPAPTREPASKARPTPTMGSAGSGPAVATWKAPAARRPPRKAKSQEKNSPCAGLFTDALTPRSRPVNINLAMVATPRMAPPHRASSGVN
mmetsp:Transcript_8492/g.23691  ORF Transcript_8492/g.23691 Transcript_8492/m.23691 type:complete len:237 (-) Transcript_8492:223-933(-)